MRESKSVQRITEKRNQKSMEIDKLETEDMLKVINQEDYRVAEAVEEVIGDITKVVEEIVSRFKNNGRLFYVGAGTSGRLGVLDAVECKPTFSINSGRIEGILAGGKDAMFEAKENVEDSEELGKEEIVKREINKDDTVIGVAASGKTPFVLGAIREARRRGAYTVSLVCSENSILEEETEDAVVPIVGPEVLTGSTRMKAGTAQKMVLNMISTTVMIKLGKVYSNLMVDVNASNSKLKERAENIFGIITGGDRETARKYLEDADFNVKQAIVMYEKGVESKKAEKLLAENDGLLRAIID